MKKFQGKDWHKYAWKPRLTISDGWRTRLVHLEDLMEICHYSESHARKIIAGQKPLTPAAEDLLRMAILRARRHDKHAEWIHVRYEPTRTVRFHVLTTQIHETRC